MIDTKNLRHDMIVAIETLKEARNVKEWNIIRDYLKDKLTNSELAYIDGSGLIVEVLGKDENFTNK